MKKIFTFVFLLVSSILFAQNTQVNYALVCVDSVWYEPGNPLFINVRIYNGDTLHMNYPSVQIVSPANDTIGNPSNFVNYFAQLGNTYQTYTDTITQSGITDFSTYTFLMNELFGDTNAVIGWCTLTSVDELHGNHLNIFPNPVNDAVHIPLNPGTSATLKIYDAFGNMVVHRDVFADSQHALTIDVSRFAGGVYFISITDNKRAISAKFLKQ